MNSEQPGNEIAAFALNDLLGNLVRMPRMVMRDVEGLGESVVMEFLSGRVVAKENAAMEVIFAGKRDDVRRLALFDAITGNTDRHFGNAMWSEGRIVAIDHGYAFGNGGDHLNSFALKAIGRSLRLRVGERAVLQRVLDQEATIRTALERHLSSHRLGLIFDRTRAMLEGGSMLRHGTRL